MMQQILTKIYHGDILSRIESEHLFTALISGELASTELAAVVIALKIRGEQPQEIAGAALASIALATPFPKPDYAFADIAGTGGDGLSSINISTTSAFVCAALGFPIAKHGNRSVSSKSGASDVLAACGININLPAKTMRQTLDDLNICFLFAPQYHSGFQHAASVRQSLKTRTIFNLLGPLINPARPERILLGVYHPNLITPTIETLKLLGYQRAIVVCGDGLDEVAIHSHTQVAELHNGTITYSTLTPEDFGLLRYPLSAITGGTPEENKQHLVTLLQGNGFAAHKAVVAANCALVMRLFDHEDIKENTQRALSVLQSGKAYTLMQQFAARSMK